MGLDDLLKADNSISFEALKYGYPPALQKACGDYFQYALQLKMGEIIYFEQAVPINENWVHIKSITSVSGLPRHSFERGLDLRVDSIAWVCDAPDGS